jgi:hypothetical protein
VIIIGLLAIALVCLIVGLALPNAAWLVASLIATAGAGYLLVRSWRVASVADDDADQFADDQFSADQFSADQFSADQFSAERFAEAPFDDDDIDDRDEAEAHHDDDEAEDIAHPESPTEVTTEIVMPAVESHDDIDDLEDLDVLAAADDDPLPEPVVPAVAPPRRPVTPPAAKKAGSRERASKETASKETASKETASKETASRQTASRRSTAKQPTTPPPETTSPAAEHEVWVIDGRPRYHLEGCAIIKGQPAEPVPWDQATSDGFMPCSLCEPDSVRSA